MSSKAQGLSLNTIIIAAIVLIVLLILVGLVTGYFGSWKPKFSAATTTKCSEIGGTPTTGNCITQSAEASGFFEDVNEGQKCCFTSGCFDSGGECKSSCQQSERIRGGDWTCKGLSGRPNCCKRQ